MHTLKLPERTAADRIFFIGNCRICYRPSLAGSAVDLRHNGNVRFIRNPTFPIVLANGGFVPNPVARSLAKNSMKEGQVSGGWPGSTTVTNVGVF